MRREGAASFLPLIELGQGEWRTFDCRFVRTRSYLADRATVMSAASTSSLPELVDA
jgi:hypothetical protein